MNQASIGLGNGLSPVRRQPIIWTNAGLMSIGPLGIKIQNFSFTIHKIASENIVCETAVRYHRKACAGNHSSFELHYRSKNTQGDVA